MDSVTGVDEESAHATPQRADLPTVSVIVSTFNRRDSLLETVLPLLADPAATEVVVVVDGCRDGSFELLQTLAREEPRLTPLFVENAGQVAAQTAALEIVSGEVLLLVDDDVVASPGLVTGHARRHAESENLVVVGYMPTRVPPDGAKDAFTTLLYAEEYERASRAYSDDPASILRGLWMGNVSVRREDCQRIGFVNPHSEAARYVYHADRDFGLRCLKAGLTGIHDRGLHAEHRHVRSLHAFLRTAWHQGADTVALHRFHSDVLGPLPPRPVTADLPRPVAALVHATRHPAVRRPVLAGLTSLVRIGGWLRLRALQRSAAKVARRIEQQRGVLEALGRATVGTERPPSGPSSA